MSTGVVKARSRSGPDDDRAEDEHYHDALRLAWRRFQFCVMIGNMSSAAGQEFQLRAGFYARLPETYDAAEPVPTQLANGERHAERRGWVVAGRFKDDGFSAFKEIQRDDFVR